LALETLNQKWEGSYTITDLGKRVKSINMGNFPLGPLMAIILDTPLSSGLIQPPSIVNVPLAVGITF
jgi:hypothetical protein